MMDCAQSPDGRVKIEQARAEIDAAKGIVADNAHLKARRAQRRACPSANHLTSGNAVVHYMYEIRIFVATMNPDMEKIEMTLMRVRRAAQLTLPAEVRRALNVQEGDFLEAEITKDGVLLKPVSIVERQRAMSRIKEIAARVIDSEPDPNEDPQIEEEAIAAEVMKMRRQRRHA